jgi:S1-C subfamily serine protease
VRAAAFALACAALGGAAALGIGAAAGLVGGSTSETVVVHEQPRPRSSPAAVRAPRTVVPVPASRFAPARIYARRAAGVVTVFSTFAGTAAQGSGFVVSRTGTILTNAHVITNAGETTGPVNAAESVYVQFADRDRIPASVVGEPVAAIGSPLGNADSLAVGIVSAVHRSIAALTALSFHLLDAIQTDAPIAHGSSGGPLLDSAARRSLLELLTKGHVTYAYAGVQAEDVTPSLAAALKLPVRRGALVDRVTPGGPAAGAGLRGGRSEQEFEGQTVHVGGDVVVAVDGLLVESADTFVRIVTNTLRPG